MRLKHERMVSACEGKAPGFDLAWLPKQNEYGELMEQIEIEKR